FLGSDIPYFLLGVRKYLIGDNKSFRAGVELKDFSLNEIFLANYVQSDDFCFFSSRKRRNKIRLCLFPIFVFS
ncbi:MAG: hypothetical protein L0213_14385, partial [Candidatus Dadabacteria bacterium]|nr:hypothetical protein [Candidatus Dadabacteria bacterium]